MNSNYLRLKFKYTTFKQLYGYGNTIQITYNYLFIENNSHKINSIYYSVAICVKRLQRPRYT